MNAEEFIAREEQKVIENLWSARNAVTVDDLEFLAELKVEYGDCCGLETNAPLTERADVVHTAYGRISMYDCVLDWMKREGVPLTRENYLDVAYMGNPPEEIGGEIEASIPQEIRDAEDTMWMAALGVRYEPETDE